MHGLLSIYVFVICIYRCPCLIRMLSMGSIMESTGASSALAATSPATWRKGEVGFVNILLLMVCRRQINVEMQRQKKSRKSMSSQNIKTQIISQVSVLLTVCKTGGWNQIIPLRHFEAMNTHTKKIAILQGLVSAARVVKLFLLNGLCFHTLKL